MFLKIYIFVFYKYHSLLINKYNFMFLDYMTFSDLSMLVGSIINLLQIILFREKKAFKYSYILQCGSKLFFCECVATSDSLTAI